MDPLKSLVAATVKDTVREYVAQALRDRYPGAEVRVDTSDNLVATIVIRPKDSAHPDLNRGSLGTRHFQVKISEVM